MAQMAISAVGVAAAPMSGGASLALSLGMLAGSTAISMATRPKNQGSSGKLNDLKMSSSAYGRGIPQVWGTMRCTGNMFWATDIEEKKRYVGQKGKEKSSKKAKKGKATEVYEYYGNFAMGLCEGPMEEVIRIWADSNLIYDKHNPKDAVAPGFSQSSDGGGKTGTNKKGDNANGSFWPFRFYSGVEEQLQDPYMVEKQGADMVPAYRGLCYLMFERMPLRDFGNRVPTITAEVVPRKVRHIDLAPWPAMEFPPFEVTNTERMISAIDPLRMRIYQSVFTSTSAHQVRVWDFAIGQEINRVDLGDLKFIGISGNGNLMASGPTLSNSAPVYEINANTGALINKWGQHSSHLSWRLSLSGSLFGGPGLHIPHTFASAPVMKVSPTGEISYITILRSLFGHMGSINEWGMVTASNHTFPGHAGHVHTISPAAPDMYGSYWYIEYNSLYLIRASDFGYPEPPAEDFPTIAPYGNPFLTISHPDHPGAEMSIEPPIWMTGAECYLIIYTTYTSPARTYARTIDVNGNTIWEKYVGSYNIAFLTHKPWVDYIPIPATTGQRWGFLFRDTYVVIDAATGEIKQEALPMGFPEVTGPQYFLDHQSRFIFWGEGTASSGEAREGWYSAYVDKYQQVPVDVADICRDVCEKAGIPREKVITADMDFSEVSGYMIENPMPARDALEQLSQVYFFDVCESDYLLKFRSRGTDPVVTVPQAHLGRVEGGTDSDYYRETIAQEIDLPQTVMVSFINSDDDYQTGTQYYRRPNSPMPVMQSRDRADINLPIAMTPTQAKHVAEKVLYSSWGERHTHEMVLPWQYLMYDATDVMTFVMDNGLMFSDRIIGANIGANFSIQVAGVIQEHHAYIGTGVGMPSGGAIKIPKVIEPMVMPLLMDIPYTEDVDQGETPGAYPLYWAAGAMDDGFKYGALQLKDPPADFLAKGTTQVEAVWGSVSGVVPPPPHGPFVTDDKTVITLVPAFDFESRLVYDWASIPAAEWPSYDNMILIGGEIILFRDVQLTANGTVLISHLIRGHRGTENWADDHRYGEQFVILNTEAHKIATVDPISFNEDLVGKIVAPGWTQILAPTKTVKFEAKALKPYAPADIRRTDAPEGSTISWQRRTRFNGGLKDGLGTVPLNEESLVYRLFIAANPIDDDTFDPGALSQYVRMVELTTDSYLYTDAQRAADGFTAGSTFYVAVYQMSADVGYGFPGIAKLETTAPAYKVI